MTLDEFAATQVPSEMGSTLDNAGPQARALADRVKSEDLTRTLVANTFWQAYLKTNSFRDQLGMLDLTPEDVFASEPVVVRHGAVGDLYGERFTLLIEIASWPDDKPPETLHAAPTRSDLAQGWSSAMEDRIRNWERAERRTRDPRRIQEVLDLSAALAEEARQAVPFHLILLPETETKLTSTPQPPAGLGQAGPVMDATAGAAVRDQHGRIGVTGPAHAIPAQGQVTIEQGGTQFTGTVASHEAQYTDSCFIVLDRDPQTGGFPLALRSTQGPLKLAPRLHSSASFEGIITHPSVSTIIKAANWELPYIDPLLQQTVRTDPVTTRGDSGAALMDDQDYIVGFAYSRNAQSNLPAHLQYAAWIWADAVFARHDLVPY